MSGAVTRPEGRQPGAKRGMKRRLATTAAITVSMLGGAAALAPAAIASPGDLAGTWTSVDVDGSNQTMAIKGAGNAVYSMFLRDDFTSGVCGGTPAQAVGTGVTEGDGLFMLATLVCLPGGNPLPGERIFIGFQYDAATDTLMDDFGVVWERAG